MAWANFSTHYDNDRAGGCCSAIAANWARNVKKSWPHGISKLYPLRDHIYWQKAYAKRHETCAEVFDDPCFGWLLRRYSLHYQCLAIPATVGELCQYMANEKGLFLLGIDGKKGGHTIGTCQLTPDWVFFDPDFGQYVFHNRKAFHCFTAYHMQQYYSDLSVYWEIYQIDLEN